MCRKGCLCGAGSTQVTVSLVHQSRTHVQLMYATEDNIDEELRTCGCVWQSDRQQRDHRQQRDAEMGPHPAPTDTPVAAAPAHRQANNMYRSFNVRILQPN